MTIKLTVDVEIADDTAQMTTSVDGVFDTPNEGTMLVMYLTWLHLLQTDKLNDMLSPEAEDIFKLEVAKVRLLVQQGIDDASGLSDFFGIRGKTKGGIQ